MSHSARQISIAGFAFILAGIALGFTIQAAGSGQTPALSGRPTMTPQERAERFQPGPAWDPSAPVTKKGRLSALDVQAFRDFPLVWLGPEFAGYNLREIVREEYAGTREQPARDNVLFIYGQCTPAKGTSACPVPVSVRVHNNCFLTRESIEESVKSSSEETVRGAARLQRFGDGHIVLWFGKVAVSIKIPADSSLNDLAVQQLRGTGGPSGFAASGALPAPDTSACP